MTTLVSALHEKIGFEYNHTLLCFHDYIIYNPIIKNAKFKITRKCPISNLKFQIFTNDKQHVINLKLLPNTR